MAIPSRPLSNLQLQELIQHRHRQAEAARETAAAYFQKHHLDQKPEPGSRDDFDRDYHLAEHQRLNALAEPHEAAKAGFTNDLLVRQGKQPLPLPPRSMTADERQAIIDEAAKLLPPAPPAPPQSEQDKNKGKGAGDEPGLGR